MSTKGTKHKQTSARLVEDNEVVGVTEAQPHERRNTPVVLRRLAKEETQEKQRPATENTLPPPAVAPEAATSKTLFMRRLFAWMTDSVLISLLAGIAVFICVTGFEIARQYNVNYMEIFSPERLLLGSLFFWIAVAIYNFAPVLSIFLILNIMFKTHASLESFAFACSTFIVASLVQQAYYLIFTEGHKQATPGKIIFGLKVETESGTRASRPSILTREMIKAVSSGFLGIPLLFTLFFPERRLLHEAISRTKVVSVEPKKVGNSLAPIAACISTLIVGFVVCQLAAPIAYEFSISPKLAIYKRLYGLNSKAFHEQLWQHIDTLFHRYKDLTNRAERYHLLTPHELAVFDEAVELLQKYGDAKDPRFIAAYREAIRHFDFRDADGAKERYLRQFIQLSENNNDSTFFETRFDCSDGFARNAYGALADHCLLMGDRAVDQNGKNVYFRQAWITGVRGTLKLKDKPPTVLIDAVLTKARAASRFNDKLILAAALKELIPIELAIYQKPGDVYPREIQGVGSVYEIFNDMLTLAEIQVNRNEFAELDKTLATMTSTYEKYKNVDTWVADRFRRVSPDEATQLEHYARLYPKYAKTLNYMAGNR